MNIYDKGMIVVKPISAKLTRNTEKFGKMDPYVKLRLGEKVERGPVAKKQHLNPKWDHQFVMRYNNEQTLLIEVWNKEKITRDDLVGTGKVSIPDWLSTGVYTLSEWIPLVYKNKEAGNIMVELEFRPDGGFRQEKTATVTTSNPQEIYNQTGIIPQDTTNQVVALEQYEKQTVSNYEPVQTKIAQPVEPVEGMIDSNRGYEVFEDAYVNEEFETLEDKPMRLREALELAGEKELIQEDQLS